MTILETKTTKNFIKEKNDFKWHISCCATNVTLIDDELYVDNFTKHKFNISLLAYDFGVLPFAFITINKGGASTLMFTEQDSVTGQGYSIPFFLGRAGDGVVRYHSVVNQFKEEFKKVRESSKVNSIIN